VVVGSQVPNAGAERKIIDEATLLSPIEDIEVVLKRLEVSAKKTAKHQNNVIFRFPPLCSRFTNDVECFFMALRSCRPLERTCFFLDMPNQESGGAYVRAEDDGRNYVGLSSFYTA